MAPLQLAAFLAERGMSIDVASIHREHIGSFLEALLTRRSAATANNRYRGLVAFFVWLTDEGEIPTSPMARMKPRAIQEREGYWWIECSMCDCCWQVPYFAAETVG